MSFRYGSNSSLQNKKMPSTFRHRMHLATELQIIYVKESLGDLTY